MKNKIIIGCMLLLSCLPSYAGKNTANFALGAVIGALGGAAIASNMNRNTCSHTEYVYDSRPQCYPSCYTERVEVCRPVVETRRVYTRPARIVTYNTRPVTRYTEVYYGTSAPVYECNQYCSARY